MKNTYSVCVGNVGDMPETSKKAALQSFAQWVKLSKGSQGRASGEDVTLFINGEPVKEYFAPISDKF